MGSRIRENVQHFFECFCEVVPPTDSKDAWIIQQYPYSYKDEEVLKSVSKFAYPYKFENTVIQHYSFVLTDIESKWTFGFCRHDPRSQTAIVVLSYLPWHQAFYKFLDNIAVLMHSRDTESLNEFLSAVYRSKLMGPGKKFVVPFNRGENTFSVDCPQPIAHQLPSIPENRNLTEYYNAVDANNMMTIFASMLYERRIIFTSKRLTRLSACVQSANDLLYPMIWQHIFIPVLPMAFSDYLLAPMPFLIGVPDEVLKIVNRCDIGDVVILDADNNTIETPFDDVHNLPSEVVASLKKQLKNRSALLGDGVSRAFLRALVQLIGGYRDALSFEDKANFDEEKFIETRPSSLQPFLKEMLQLQIFRQFIEERLNILGAGLGFTDQFETEVSCYSEKSSSKLKQQYKEWTSTMKKEGTAFFKNVKDKANPAMKSAVKTRMWSVLHVLWSTLYVSCGAAQLVAGIFFLISIPSLHLSCNLWAGTWNIFVGIGGGMVACFGQLSARRQELLLYMAISILIVNSVNAVLSEWGYYYADTKKLLSAHQYQVLISYASIATRASSALVIIISFLDSQLAFCSMQAIPKQEKKKTRGSHEQVSDIEYIIPRRKSSKPHTVYNAYSQSWVYDAETTAATSNNHTTETSPYVQVPRDDNTPKQSIGRRRSGLENGIIGDTTHLIDNPVVHIEEASDDSNSNSNSDRKLCYMKSFSRSASPVVLSASSSQISLNNPPIYEYLQKLTEPEIYRSRLNSALSNKSEEGPQYQAPQPVMTRRDPVSPNVEKVQYASLMKELQKAIVSKKEPSQITPPSNSESVTSSDKTSSRSDTKNSDAEFSKELEAALQLIQDLESPNTIETPSEPKVFGEKEERSLSVWRNSDASESEKTLSAVGSLAEIASPLNECQPEMTTFKPSSVATTINGKSARVIIQNSESQSTSGYSSPTHKTPDWSTTSSVSSSNHDLVAKTPSNMTYSIHNTKSTAVISLYTGESPKAKNVTLVSITGNNERRLLPPPILSSTLLNEHDFQNNNNVISIINNSNLNNNTSHPLNNNNNNTNIKNIDDVTANFDMTYDCQTDDEKYEQQSQGRASINSGNLWNVRSLLRKKKNVPKLCPELEGAIIKSESLAYLSEIELVARHQRNKDIQRQIEERVLQQMGTPRTESNC